jgi:hypothetical protein
MCRPRKGAQYLPEMSSESLPTSSLEDTRKEIFQKPIEYYLQKLKTFITSHPIEV